MTFEFDPAKSKVNRRKHGIEFIAAQALWRDPALLEILARTIDFPVWMVEQFDREASRLGVTRQSIIKVWLAERLERRPDAQDPVLMD